MGSTLCRCRRSADPSTFPERPHHILHRRSTPTCQQRYRTVHMAHTPDIHGPRPVDPWTLEAVGVFLLLPLALWQVSASSKNPFDTAQQPVRRTPVVIWTIPILILLALEFLAILLTTVHNRYDYPTISSLIDPLFNTRVGHIICVTLWLTAGAALLIPRRSPATSEVSA
jgi:hypothetical protein